MPADRGEGPGVSVDAALLVMAMFWAGNMIALKWLLGVMSPPVLSGIRFAMVSLVALVVLALRGGPWRIERRDVPRLLACAFLGVTAYQILFMEGLDRTTAFVSNLVQGMEPLFVLFLVAAIGTQVRPRQWAGVLVALFGSILFFLQGEGTLVALKIGVGDVLNFASALVFAVFGLLNGALFQRYPGRTVMALSMTAGTLPLLAWSWPDIARAELGSWSPWVWLALALSSVLPVFIGYWIWGWAIAKKGLAHASLFIFVDIVVSGVLSWLILGERFGPLRLLGAAIILAGVRLAR